MGACHATERVHNSPNKKKSLEKQNTTPSVEKKQKSQEYSELDLSGETLPNADLYVTNLNISPSLVIFFGTFYKKRITLLQNSDSLVGNISNRDVFAQKLATLNAIDIDTAHIWVKAYIDFMILMAWNYFAVEEKDMYAPFAIQQTHRLHLSYPSDYKSFCSIITEGKNFIHYSPKKTVCNNQSIDLFESLYDEAKESIMIYLYESKQISQPNPQETEQIKEIWESFYETFIKNEYSFYLNNSNIKASKSNIQKAISKISTNNHNFSLASEGPSLLRSSLNLAINGTTEGSTVLSAINSDVVSEEERNIARIVDEIKFPIGFSQLLSWEQVISLSEAQEWIAEYNKFIFLNLLGKPLNYVLSEKIKQVWLLHVSFTKNYEKFFIEHLTKNNLRMMHNFEKRVEENGDDVSKLYNKYFGSQNEAIWTLTAEEDGQSQPCANFYSDIVKKQEELLSIKLACALTDD